MQHNSNFQKKNDKSFDDLLQIIMRKKYYLIVSLIIAVSIAFLYNTLSPKIYQTAVLLKKENQDKKSFTTSNINGYMMMNSNDEVETEIELVKTNNVFNSVIDELKLNLKVQKIEYSDGSIKKINSYLFPYIEENEKELPKFSKVFFGNDIENLNMIIEKRDENKFKVTYQKPEEDKFDNFWIEDVFKFNDASFSFSWDNAKVGDKLYFKFNDDKSLISELNKIVEVKRKSKTDLIEIEVSSTSPNTAMQIANTMADQFKESRLKHKKQSVSYSYEFLDNQIKEIGEKLKVVQDSITQFKARSHITNITDNSRDLIQRITELEAERVKTNLTLIDYENKIYEIQEHLNNNSYVDQTYLAPDEVNRQNSPFADLQQQLSNLELQKTQLLQKRKENHPDVAIVTDQIQQIKEKLAEHNKNTLTAYKIIVASNGKKLNEINSLIDKYNQKMTSLPPQESKLADLVRQQKVFEEMYSIMLDQKEELRMAELSKLQDIAIIDLAKVPSSPVYPLSFLNLIIGLFGGSIIGFFLIFVTELFNRKLVNISLIEEHFKLPILAVFPKFSHAINKKIRKSPDYKEKIVTASNDYNLHKESYRLLKIKLSFIFKNSRKVFMLTSFEEDTGKTTVTANLAFSLIHSGNKVLLIDADLRKAGLSTVFDLHKDAPGMIQYLTSSNEIPHIHQVVTADIENSKGSLSIITSGGVTRNSTEIIDNDKLKILLSLLANNYDYIIIDTPPVTKVADTLILGKVCSNALIVIRPNYTYRESIELGLQEIREANINVHGALINACDIENTSFKYRYGYGYGYYYGNEKSDDKFLKLFKRKKQY